MFCKYCGAQLEEGVAFCANCGKKLNEEKAAQVQYERPSYQYSQQGHQGYEQHNSYVYQGTTSRKGVSFGEAIKLYFINYANFSGRATKSEYWWACLFNFLVVWFTGSIPVLGQLIQLVLFLPGLSVAVRRLHDTGKSWFYNFIALIPIVGGIILIVQYCKDSDGDNKWGPAPRFY